MVKLHLSGFNDKLHVLLDEILKCILNLEIQRDIFDNVAEQVKRELKNFDQEVPYHHAMYFWVFFKHNILRAMLFKKKCGHIRKNYLHSMMCLYQSFKNFRQSYSVICKWKHLSMEIMKLRYNKTIFIQRMLPDFAQLWRKHSLTLNQYQICKFELTLWRIYLLLCTQLTC